MTLDELAKLESLATPGPWHVGHINESLDRGAIENCDGVVIASDVKRCDEPFICALRNAAPKIIALVNALKNERKDHQDCYCSFADGSFLCIPCFKRIEKTDEYLEEIEK